MYLKKKSHGILTRYMNQDEGLNLKFGDYIHL